MAVIVRELGVCVCVTRRCVEHMQKILTCHLKALGGSYAFDPTVPTFPPELAFRHYTWQLYVYGTGT